MRQQQSESMFNDTSSDLICKELRCRTKRARGVIDADENESSKDGENSLSQSLFDEQTSSRTRTTRKAKALFQLNRFSLSFSINRSKNKRFPIATWWKLQ